MANAPLLGAPFKQDVRRQLQIRSQKRASQNLTDRDLAVQHGSTGWARISSGVVIKDGYEKAKNNVLQGGVLSKINKGFKQKSDDSLLDQIKYGASKDSSYTKDSAQGFKPIPGIDSIEIATQNTQGTIRKTDVAFKVNSLEQLEDFERLYLRPGFSVLLEYGHSAYYDNDGNIINDVPSVVDFFGTADQEVVVEKIIQLQKESNYNYDAIFGLIMNFQYAFNMDGGYDCTFYIISKGSLLESILAISSGDTKNSTKTDSLSLVEEATNTAAMARSLLTGKKSEKSDQDNKSVVLEILNRIYEITGQQEPIIDTLIDEFPSLDFLDADKPYYLHDISTDKPNSAKKVYMTFSTLLKILNNTVNLVVNGKTEFIKLGYNDDFTVNSTFLTYPNHFSSNPNVCLLKKGPADKQLSFAEIGNDFPAATGKGNQINTDIFLDISFLANTLSTLADGSKKNHSIVDFLKIVFEKVSIALGGINEFDFHYIELPEDGKPIPTVYIVDRRITPTSTDIRTNIIPCYGKGALLSNISVTSKISNELSTLMALGAQASGTNLSNYSGLVLNYNKGLEDKFKTTFNDGVNKSNDADESSDPDDYAEKIKTIKDSVENFVKGSAFKDSDGKSLEEPHKFITNSDVQKALNPIQGVLPFELSFTMQGIAGLVIGQGFKLQNGILPGHVQDTAGFILRSVNHSIQGNVWTTDISAYMTLCEPDPEKITKKFEDVEVKEEIQEQINLKGPDKTAK